MKYEEAMAAWGRKRLRELGVPFHTVRRVDIDYSYEEGCPTCGGTVNFDVTIYYTASPSDKRHKYQTETVDFDKFLRGLFEVSE